MKRFLCMFLAVILLLTLPVNVHAASKDEKAVEKQINTFFKYVKNYEHGKVASLVNRKGDVKYWIDPSLNKTLKKIQKKSLQYKIESISVNGKKATAKVSVLYYNSNSIVVYCLKKMIKDGYKNNKFEIQYDYLSRNINKDFKREWKGYKSSVDYYSKHPELMENPNLASNIFSFDHAEYFGFYEYEKLSIPLVKVKGVWKIQKMTGKMNAMYDCNVTSTINEVAKNPLKYLF